MNKKEFIEMVKEMLQESLGDEYSVVEYSHVKNNKKPLSGLAIQRIGTDLGMVIYLDKVFDEYQNGREADKIAADLYREIRNAEIPKELSGDFMSALVNNYESAKPMIFSKLVNEKANREMLKEVPYFPRPGCYFRKKVCLKVILGIWVLPGMDLMPRNGLPYRIKVIFQKIVCNT